MGTCGNSKAMPPPTSTWVPLDGEFRPITTSVGASPGSRSGSAGANADAFDEEELVSCGLVSRTFDVTGVTPSIEWADKSEDPLMQRIRMRYTLQPKGKSQSQSQRQYMLERCIEVQYDAEQENENGKDSSVKGLVAPDWIRVVYSLYRSGAGNSSGGSSSSGSSSDDDSGNTGQLTSITRVVYIMQR